MFVDLPNELLVLTGGAFLLGWLLASISSAISRRQNAQKRDSRDDRIRELEAELRIASSDKNDSRTDLSQLEDNLKETTIGLERRDCVISDQQKRIVKLATDLKDSVCKTRELRAELTERATESVYAEAKIREVETELSVVQASSDMIATGVLDYATAAETIELDESPNDLIDPDLIDAIDASSKASR